MHEQGQAFCVCLANNLSKPVWANKECAEEVMVNDAQFCQVRTQAV